MKNILEQERYSLGEVASQAGVHLTTVWRWVTNGVRGRKLRSIHIGGQRYILKADLNSFLDPESNATAKSDRKPSDAGKILDGCGVKRR